MRITKFGHACIRVEYDGHTLVIDPGMFTEPEALDGADAILVTHEHTDHWDSGVLRTSSAPIHTIAAVQRAMGESAPDVAERVQVLTPGQTVDLGLSVRVVGELHAVIHPELQRFDNSGYVLTAGEQRLFHPGDSLEHPGEDIDVLCAPASAPWLKMHEAVDFVRSVGAQTNIAIHDRIYTEFAHDVVERHMHLFLDPAGQTWHRLADGADLPG